MHFKDTFLIKMGSNTSAPVSSPENADSTAPKNVSKIGGQDEFEVKKAPPAGCPMHNKTVGVGEVKTTEATKCPVTGDVAKEEKTPERKFTISDCPVHAGKTKENQGSDENDLNPANLVISI